MAKSIIIQAAALCFLSLLGFAYCEDRFFVEGRVYCDTCRTQFVTKLTKYMKGNNFIFCLNLINHHVRTLFPSHVKENKC
jgi:hypothetical protein